MVAVPMHHLDFPGKVMCIEPIRSITGALLGPDNVLRSFCAARGVEKAMRVAGSLRDAHA